VAMACETPATHPDLVGLQEVSKFTVNGRTVLDYEPVLLAALAAHGQHYAAAIEQPEGDITRAIPGLGVTELQLSNIILARTDRADLVVGNPRGASFISQATFLGQPITRNWESVDARLGPTQFKFLNTSLEIGNDQTSTRQAAELIVGPLRSTAPVIAVGDLNSGPLSAQKGAYVLLTSPTAGNLRDAAAGAGLTCCRAELMSATEATDPKASLTERVDFVFTSPATVQAISALRTGIDQFLTPAGVPEFASDHTGVVATLRVP
jgi:endonuclease/exonuclease/phosphatase family metal-dependent hydrolase